MFDLIFVLLILTGFVFLGSGPAAIRHSHSGRAGRPAGTDSAAGKLAGFVGALNGAGNAQPCDQGFGAALFSHPRHAEVEGLHEDNPFVGFTSSMVVGIVCLGGSFWLASRLPFLESTQPQMAVAVSLFHLFVGLFVIISRRKALTQVLGLSGDGKRSLYFWSCAGRGRAAAGGIGRTAGCVCGRFRDGHHDFPHQQVV